MLSCRVRPYGNMYVTVELTDNLGRRLAFEKHSLVNSALVQYNVSVTSSTSAPFHCIVTASVVTMETVSKTLTWNHLHVIGEFFESLDYVMRRRPTVISGSPTHSVWGAD